MIDTNKRQERFKQKEKVRKRMRVEIDPNNYEFIPAKKPIDYYDNDVPQRVAIYVRVSTDDIRQTTSYELQKIYYEDFVNHHPNWTLVKIYADAADIIGLNQNPTQKGADLVLIFYFSARFEVITARIIT